MLSTTTIIIIAITVVNVAAVVAGICRYAERFVKRIAGPAENATGRELIQAEVRERLERFEASARTYRSETQAEAWSRVADLGADLEEAAIARSPAGRKAEAKRLHAAS